MSVSILVVDDEMDVAELFRQQFRREVRQGQYVIHFAQSAEEALGKYPKTEDEAKVAWAKEKGLAARANPPPSRHRPRGPRKAPAPPHPPKGPPPHRPGGGRSG